ncbi:hypothetical protein Pres01_40530 [Metapseudomonas resinovorans]|nr:hypothetical protein Pres01_40530 [Pseudomonas resinovorans]
MIYRHQAAIREFLQVKAFYGSEAPGIALRVAQDAAEIFDQLETLFALSNLWMARRQLLATPGEVRL